MVTGIVQEDLVLEIACKGTDEELWNLLRTLVNNEIPVISFNKVDGNLEHIFMEVTSDEEVVL